MKNSLKLEKNVMLPLSEDLSRKTSAGSCSINPASLWNDFTDSVADAWDSAMDGFADGANCTCKE